MPYKIHYKDVIIECNTVEEALQFTSRLKSVKVEAVQENHPDTHHTGETIPAGSRWTEKRFRDFLDLTKNSGQYKVLKLLWDNPDGKTLNQILSEFNWSNGRILAGVLAGVSKNALKVGVGNDDVYDLSRVTIAGELQKEYKLKPSFRSVIERYGGME